MSAISVAAFRPYFAAEVPVGTYHLRVIDLAGPTTYDCDIVIPAGCYWLAGHSDVGCIGTVIAVQIAAQVGMDFAWRSFGPSDAVGIEQRFQSDDFAFTLDYTNSLATDAGKLPLEWVGLPNADATSVTFAGKEVVDSTQYPALTWFPKVRANDFGTVPSPQQVTFSPMTEDGQTATVVMGGRISQRPKWRTIYLDGTVGVHGARIQRSKCAQPLWAASIGVVTDAPFVPLDYPGGWADYAVSGVPLIMGDEASFEFDGPMRIHASAECPEEMLSFLGLRPGAVRKVYPAKGLRDVRLAFLVDQ